MADTICINASTINYLTGGGHRWVYLNWALSLRDNGCRVIWNEGVLPEWGAPLIRELTQGLREQLRPWGMDRDIGLYSYDEKPVPSEAMEGCLSLDDTAAAADLLVNFSYAARADILRRYKRTTLIDIDPGIMQLWVHAGQIKLTPHDTYFSIGETVGRPGSNLPDLGIPWHYTPPCVSLEAWTPSPRPPGAPFTTVSQWRGGDWIVFGDESYNNEKREGFLPYLDLPQRTSQPLELALGLGKWDGEERRDLESRGWRVREASEVTATALDYQRYIQGSAGEFSGCKPSCVKLANAWISDRTLCYLASGKPAVVQHTGPSRLLPDRSGLFRVNDVSEAADALEHIGRNYESECAAARALAEKHFDGRCAGAELLNHALRA